MTCLLIILASPAGEEAYSTRAAHVLATRLTAGKPEAEIVIRDLGAKPPPHLDAVFVDAISTPRDQRTAEQREQLALSDEYAAEIEAADAVVIATPMINFGMPSPLKAWFDHVLGPGVRWTAARSATERQYPGRKVYLVEARVPISGGGPEALHDFLEPQVAALMGLMGMTDVEVIAMDCLAQDPETALKLFDASLREISRRFR